MNRRNFIKAASSGVLLLGTAPSISHTAAENRLPIPGSLGMFYDSALCIGCQAYVTKCQNINFPACNPGGEQTWSNNDKLSPCTNNTIQVWHSEIGANKDQGENGHAYIKRQCMYCVDPNYVSVCPASALKRNPKAGIIHYDKDVCMGCHYYMAACSYSVPKYDYNSPLGALRKCKLCNQKGVECLGRSDLPGCVEVCPAGAVIFGTREELTAEAKKRLALKPGNEYHYPCQTVKAGDTYLHVVSKYYPYLYGGKEGDGTQIMVLTDTPYEDLDLPKLDDLSTDAHSEYVQHSLYKGMISSLAVLAGLTVLVYRGTRNDHHDGGNDHRS